MAEHKRKKYFIEKKLQSKYILISVLFLLIYTMLFIVILFTPYILPFYFDFPLEERIVAARGLLSLHQSVWPALGVVILIMGGLSIFVTHKIAGPVYRFKKTLAEISGGNLDVVIRLRKRDDLKDLAEDLNLMIREMRLMVETLQVDRDTMSSCITELEDQVANNKISSEVAVELVRKMQLNRENISQVLDKYSR